MKTIAMFSTIGGRKRSLLLGLSKIQIVEGILEKGPVLGWARIIATLKLHDMRDKDRDLEVRFTRGDKRKMNDMLEKVTELKAQLLRTNRATLVEMTYHLSDLTLQRKYGSPQQTLKELPTVLKEEREIEIDRRTITRLVKKGLKKPTEPTVKKSKQRKVKKQRLTPRQSRKASKVRTLSWIESVRSHLSFMKEDTTTMGHAK